MNNNLINILVFAIGVISIINTILLIVSIRRRNKHIEVDAKDNFPIPLVEEDILVKDGAREKIRRTDVLMSKVTEDRLLKDFEKLKKSNFFLKQGVSLNDLASALDTNQRYVSYILNNYEGVDFNKYVQQIRISYVIECIEQDPDLLNEKFSVLAEKAGFSSVNKFSSVFKSIMEITPSEYFLKLRMKQ